MESAPAETLVAPVWPDQINEAETVFVFMLANRRRRRERAPRNARLLRLRRGL